MVERRTVVVTGGSSGIGLAAAAALARAGDDVVLLGRHPERLVRAVDVVRAAGGRTPAAYRADFAVLDEVRRRGRGSPPSTSGSMCWPTTRGSSARFAGAPSTGTT